MEDGAELGVDVLGGGGGDEAGDLVEHGAEVAEGGDALSGALAGGGVFGDAGAGGLDEGVELVFALDVVLQIARTGFEGFVVLLTSGKEFLQGALLIGLIGETDGVVLALVVRGIGGGSELVEQGGDIGGERGEKVGVFAVDVFGILRADPTAARVCVSAGVGDPAAGATDAAVEEIGETLGADAGVFPAAFLELVVDARLGGHVPERGVGAAGGDNAGGWIGRGGDFPSAGIDDAAGASEGYFSTVEALFEDEPDVDIGPLGFSGWGGDAFGGEGVGDLPEGPARQKEIFDAEDDGSGERVLDGDGVPVEFPAGGLAVAVGRLMGGESFLSDAAGHAEFVAAAEGGDLGSGCEASHELKGGGGFVDVELLRGDGVDGL